MNLRSTAKLGEPDLELVLLSQSSSLGLLFRRGVLSSTVSRLSGEGLETKDFRLRAAAAAELWTSVREEEEAFG